MSYPTIRTHINSNFCLFTILSFHIINIFFFFFKFQKLKLKVKFLTLNLKPLKILRYPYLNPARLIIVLRKNFICQSNPVKWDLSANQSIFFWTISLKYGSNLRPALVVKSKNNHTHGQSLTAQYSCPKP